MPQLFSPLTVGRVTLRNRVVMPPMCIYQAGLDGLATDWHVVHYGARAIGGAGLIILEATAVEARGRISQGDLGLWDDAHVEPLSGLVRFCQEQGAAVAVQLAHAGRKAWSPRKGVGPDMPVAPSAVPHDADWIVPQALTREEIDQTVAAFAAAAERAGQAGFDGVELHAAHGYLLHEFLSPLSNRREDGYGGSLANRARLLLQVVEAVRGVWPEGKPLLVRLSVTDWVEEGLSVDDQVQVSRWLEGRGVDVIDCSSGGIIPFSPPDVGPGYQVPLAEAVRRAVDLPVIAVGLITTPELADAVVRNGLADLVALGRELLRHPQWPLEAARTLGQEIEWPLPYRRAR